MRNQVILSLFAVCLLVAPAFAQRDVRKELAELEAKTQSNIRSFQRSLSNVKASTRRTARDQLLRSVAPNRAPQAAERRQSSRPDAGRFPGYNDDEILRAAFSIQQSFGRRILTIGDNGVSLRTRQQNDPRVNPNLVKGRMSEREVERLRQLLNAGFIPRDRWNNFRGVLKVAPVADLVMGGGQAISVRIPEDEFTAREVARGVSRAFGASTVMGAPLSLQQVRNKVERGLAKPATTVMGAPLSLTSVSNSVRRGETALENCELPRTNPLDDRSAAPAPSTADPLDNLEPLIRAPADEPEEEETNESAAPVTPNEEADETAVVMTGGTRYPPKVIRGIDGRDGRDGTDGRDGEDGKMGAPGRDGKGITEAQIVEGQLVFQYTDNTTQNVGYVVGRDGVVDEKLIIALIERYIKDNPDKFAITLNFSDGKGGSGGTVKVPLGGKGDLPPVKMSVQQRDGSIAISGAPLGTPLDGEVLTERKERQLEAKINGK